MAADEPCLTTSAISRQIKALEKYLGLRLFCRKSRGVVLTKEAEPDAYVPEMAMRIATGSRRRHR
jgi:hypothetical protein